MSSALRVRGLWVVWTGLCVLVALVSYRYVFGLPPQPEEIAGNAFAAPWLALHAGAASTALLAGPFQFFGAIRRGRPGLHRLVGRIYVSACLVGGLTAIPLSMGPTTGPVSSAGFGLLAAFWLWTTAMGWRAAALDRDFAAHQQWMVRSFALTCAAVTLRLYLGLLMLTPIPFEMGYPAIAFLCWVPNALVAEWIIRRRHHRALLLAQ